VAAVAKAIVRALVAGALTLSGATWAWAEGEVNISSADARNPTYHASVTDFMTQAPQKKRRWWWHPMELIGFKKEEPKAKAAPLQSAQQIARPLPGTATGTYRGVGK
jgi:hypothetical protein